LYLTRMIVARWRTTPTAVFMGVAGLSISFFGFSCRKAFSATTFTVIGVVNKFLTVLINLTIWDRHASTPGVISLLVCITGAVFYQQSAKLESRRHRNTPVLTDKTPSKSNQTSNMMEGSASKPVVGL